MKNKIFLLILAISLISLVLAIENTRLDEINFFSTANLNNISTGEEVDAIVTFKENINKTFLENSGAEIKENLESIYTSIITADKETIENIQDSPAIAVIEPDIDLELFGEGEIVDINKQVVPWGVERVNAPKIWNSTIGKNIRIAVIDSGINKNHSDLIGNVIGGVSFINDSKYWEDDLGHGTSVAGVISALNNEIGVVGVAPESKLYSIKVIGTSGGKLSNFIQGIQWAIDNNMDIIVMSLGIAVDSPSLKRMVDEAYSKGIILVAASGKDNQIYYPAKYSSVIAVGSINENNELTSENGAGEELEFVAPGTNVISINGENYGSFDGTSMAAPHVAGVIALLKESNLVLSNNEIRAKLQRNAIDLGKDGKDNFFGYGLVNAYLKTENLNATIQIIFPEELNNTGFIKVEIIKVENNQEKVVQTLFYSPNKKTENVSVESGTYKIKQYFENNTYEERYNISYEDLVVVPLHGVNPPVHQWVSYQAKSIWTTSEINSYLPSTWSNSISTLDTYGIMKGARMEDDAIYTDDGLTSNLYYPCFNTDLNSHPYCNHFWANPHNSDSNGLYYAPPGYTAKQWNSAYTRAKNIWDNNVIPYYQSNKSLSYYWLGRVTHLLTDMSVPAHVHLDVHVETDSYENYMKEYNDAVYQDYNFKLWSYSGSVTSKSTLYDLFNDMAEIADDYDSNDASGENLTHYEGHNCEKSLGVCVNDVSPAEAKNHGDTLMPQSMRHVAGLYRLFWAETHNLTGCTSGACCNTSLTLTKENGQQPTGIFDYNFCSGNNVYTKDYYCNGASSSEQSQNIFVKTCLQNEICENGVCKSSSCIIPTNGMTITQNTIFCRGNHSLPNGINISTNNIVLDCNSSSIRGNLDGKSYVANNQGIKISATNVTIKNCEISNYSHGIASYSDNTYSNKIINNIIKWNFRGIDATNRQNIFNNSIKDNVVGVSISANHPDVLVNYNDLFSNSALNLYNGIVDDQINALNNYWGTTNETGIRNKISGNVTFIPYSNSQFGEPLCAPNLSNTTWTNWINLSCLRNDKMNQTRLLVQYDTNNCGMIQNQTIYEYRANQICDFCKPYLMNTTFSEWKNQTSCLLGDYYIQNRSKIEYDSNYSLCYKITNLTSDLWNSGINKTHWEFRNQTCDNCTPLLVNSTWSNWSNISCLPNRLMNESRFLTQYDANNCEEINNETIFEYKATMKCIIQSLSLITPKEEIYNDGRVMFNLNSTNMFAKMVYSDNAGRESMLCTNCYRYIRQKALSDGNHSLLFKGMLPNGQNITNSTSFLIDSKDPQISNIKPSSNKYTNGSDFYIKYTEENLQSAILFYETEQTEKDNCDSGRNKNCSFSVDLSDYDNKSIIYRFKLRDIANNTKESRNTTIKVDTTPPVITKFDYYNDGRYINFDIGVDEINFNKIVYINLAEDEPKWETLCSTLRYGVCKKSKLFSSSYYDFKVKVIDKAGNSVERHINSA
ncbi:S8 family serine peptidase [Candidatus Pacearchaeota archaeon]|nr:S8 family serine peptidase [Candidatus Pacearchaeota archaeon]